MALSKASWESFLEHDSLLPGRGFPGMYSVFTYQMLRNLRLGISKMVKECLFVYVSSEGGVMMGRRKAVVHRCNLVQPAIQRKSRTSTLIVDFAKWGFGSEKTVEEQHNSRDAWR